MHPSGTKNFAKAPRFVSALWIPVLMLYSNDPKPIISVKVPPFNIVLSSV